jgi:hypothetical protein
MNTQSHQHLKNLFCFRPAVFLVILAAILITPGAFACHRLDQDGNPRPHGKKAICPPIIPFPEWEIRDTSAYFYDDHGHDHGHIEESGPRDFVRQGLDFDSGDFVAADLSQGMLIDTRELSKLQVKGKPNSTICRTMEGNTTVLFPEEFSYGWTDDCTDDGCAVEIRFSFSGMGFLTDGLSDQADFVMHAVIDNPDGYANPFFVDQDLSIYMFEVDYKKPGTSRTLAKCQFTPAGLGSPHFHSFMRE